MTLADTCMHDTCTDRLSDQLEFGVLKISQAAVDHARGFRAGARRVIVLVHEKTTHALEGQLAQESGPVHTAAEDQNVTARVGL